MWAYASLSDYFNIAIRYEPGDVKIKLYEIGKINFEKYISRIIGPEGYGSNAKLGDAKLKSINIFVSEANIAKLNSNLPHSGFDYVNGSLLFNDKILDVKLRYRGDFPYHWAFSKKSFRVKTSKDELFDGMRKFNLNAPKLYEQVNEFLTYRLADTLGLMTPKHEMVSIFINGKWNGVYILLEQIDEMTIRRHNRIPGDLYVGELIAKDAYTGLKSNNLFRYASVWTKAAVNNHYAENSKKPLEQLIELLKNPDSEKAAAELENLLDINAWGAFMAFETLSQTTHFDPLHNWRIYFDPATSRFYPVIWDPMGFEGGFVDFDIIASDLHYALFTNGDFLKARQRALQKFFKEEKHLLLLKEMKSITEKILPLIRYDRNIVVSYKEAKDDQIETALKKWPVEPFRVADSGKIIASWDGLYSKIEKNFSRIRYEFLQKEPETYWKTTDDGKIIDISLSGRPMLEKLIIEYAGEIPFTTDTSIVFFKGAEQKKLDISGAVNISGNRFVINMPLLARYEVQHSGESFDSGFPKGLLPASYRIYMGDLFRGMQPVAIWADYGKDILHRFQPAKDIQIAPFNSMNNIIKSIKMENPFIWEGDVLLDTQTTFKRNLIIRPGTTVRLEPGATLILTGRLQAEGTAESPIRFIPAREGQDPWGAIVLKGEGANGSRLSYCEFEGGSGLKGDLFEYSAMFSVHDVKGVEVDHCRFSDSRETDDMVHAVYSEIRFFDSEFFRSKADALDLDISKGVVERCRFVDSGNDALDLMTTEAVVLETELRNSGDKGISVGEGSTLLAMNDRFVGNVIGVQAKDGSIATLYNVDLAGNGKALDAYKKNWRYNDGGRIFLYKGRLVANPEMVTADKKSRIRLYDSYIDRDVVAKKRIRIDETVDSREMTKARQTSLWRDPDEIERLRGIDERYWASARPAVRGVSLGR